MSSTYHSPAEILRQFLKNKAVGSLLADKTDWPIYVSSMPDDSLRKGTKRVKDNAIAVHDTTGIDEGRLMACKAKIGLGAGQIVHKPGLQFVVRSEIYTEGYRKIQEISDVLQTINNTSVFLLDNDEVTHTYTINNLSRTSPPTPNGTEPGTKRRSLFSANYIATIQEE